jgi:hypothetical protein
MTQSTVAALEMKRLLTKTTEMLKTTKTKVQLTMAEDKE